MHVNMYCMQTVVIQSIISKNNLLICKIRLDFLQVEASV